MPAPTGNIADGRSNKVAVLCHCMINTNAKAVNLPTTGLYPFMINKVVECLARNSTSIVQMPCPEQLFFGFSRRSGSLDRDSMDTYEFRRYCSKIAGDIGTIIGEYVRNGFSVKCIVGCKGSPSCGITETHTSKGFESKPGILIEEIKRDLANRRIQVDFVDVDISREGAVDKDVSELERVLK